MNETTMLDSTFEKLGLENLSFLTQSFFGNTVLDWAAAVIVFLVIQFVLRSVRKVVIARLEKLSAKTKLKIDDTIINFLKHIGGFFYTAVSLFFAVQHLELPEIVNMAVKAIFLIAIVYELIRVSEKILSFIVLRKMGDQGSSLSSALSLLLRIVLWAIGLLMILSNLGIDVTALLASLGIGGLAVSLALQPLFQDMFSAFSLIIDKPFQEGDFIVTGDFKGTVKHVGLKTTRLKSLQGEELIISNSELTTARIQNFKRLQQRRIAFGIGVTYDTPAAKLRKIPQMLEDIITKQEGATFDRAHFWEFGDSSLNYEIVYFVESADYTEYMSIQQSVNLSILEVFEKDGIEMAFPTRTVHMIQG